jgi:hypothetical protein
MIALASPAIAQQCGPSGCPLPQTMAPNRPAAHQFKSTPGVRTPWATACRITIVVPGSKGISFGSGTVIDGSVPKAIVMTAAHVLRPGSSATYKVEVFGEPERFGSQPLTQIIGVFEGRPLDRIDRLDVGLLTFIHPTVLPASRLPKQSYIPVIDQPLITMGCSLGAYPTAYGDTFSKLAETKEGYEGFELKGTPAQGRSGGGCFDYQSHLVGVCDFAIKSGGGLYATTDSLRTILLKNGLTELAYGGSPPEPSSQSPPTAVPQLPQIPQLPQLPSVQEAEKAFAYLPHMIAGSLGGAGLLAGLAAFFRRKSPVPASPIVTSGFSASPEDLVRLLTMSLKAQDEAELRKKSDAELLDKIKDLVKPPSPNA